MKAILGFTLLAQNSGNFGVALIIALVAVVVVALIKTARIVPQRQAHIVERLGKYHKTLEAGFHILIPFIDRVAYKHSLKEVAMDVPPQFCITKDNIAIEIDGLLYMQVLEAKLASYGIDNYYYAASQLAQTTLRSEIGKLELDRTFEERDTIMQVSARLIVNRASHKLRLEEHQRLIAELEGALAAGVDSSSACAQP